MGSRIYHTAPPFALAVTTTLGNQIGQWIRRHPPLEVLSFLASMLLITCLLSRVTVDSRRELGPRLSINAAR